jgi:hypothetical protein
MTWELPLNTKAPKLAAVTSYTPAQSSVALKPYIKPSAEGPGELRQFTWPPAITEDSAALKLVQGCAAVHGLESLPVLDTHTTAGVVANSGPTGKEALRATAKAKSFAMILIMSSPCDVTSGWRQHHFVAKPKS